ncbi:MAG: DNA repair protein RecO [Planctomycetes bacterium GWF2_42_9]|nr:MAG: DNA repair protein RecO [Planctomycetes bacterium GWF2_42_9]
MHLIKDKGICIRSTDYSETSQILTFFTYEGGKVSVIAKGARRAKSSFCGPIEICSAGDMVYSIREGDKLGTLTEFNPTFFSTGIRKKLLAVNCSFLAAELLNIFTQEHDPHPELFEESMAFLKRLDEKADNKVPEFLIAFEFAMLTYTGSMPIIDRCANCKRKFDADWKQYYFSISARGFVCRDCEAAFVDKKAITFESASCLNDTRKCENAKNTVLVQAEELLVEYITYVLEKKPKTAQMVLQLMKSISGR